MPLLVLLACRIVASGSEEDGQWSTWMSPYNGVPQSKAIKLQSLNRGVQFTSPSFKDRVYPAERDYDYADSLPLVLGKWYTLVLEYRPSLSLSRARVLHGRCVYLVYRPPCMPCMWVMWVMRCSCPVTWCMQGNVLLRCRPSQRFPQHACTSVIYASKAPPPAPPRLHPAPDLHRPYSA